MRCSGQAQGAHFLTVRHTSRVRCGGAGGRAACLGFTPGGNAATHTGSLARGCVILLAGEEITVRLLNYTKTGTPFWNLLTVRWLQVWQLPQQPAAAACYVP